MTSRGFPREPHSQRNAHACLSGVFRSSERARQRLYFVFRILSDLTRLVERLRFPAVNAWHVVRL